MQKLVRRAFITRRCVCVSDNLDNDKAVAYSCGWEKATQADCESALKHLGTQTELYEQAKKHTSIIEVLLAHINKSKNESKKLCTLLIEARRQFHSCLTRACSRHRRGHC